LEVDVTGRHLLLALVLATLAGAALTGAVSYWILVG